MRFRFSDKTDISTYFHDRIDFSRCMHVYFAPVQSCLHKIKSGTCTYRNVSYSECCKSQSTNIVGVAMIIRFFACYSGSNQMYAFFLSWMYFIPFL